MNYEDVEQMVQTSIRHTLWTELHVFDQQMNDTFYRFLLDTTFHALRSGTFNKNIIFEIINHMSER
jgi:hypothetical protein